MTDSSLFSVSPIDGRYAKITSSLSPYFSEAALIRSRLEIEIKYLIALSQAKIIRPITPKERDLLVGAYCDTPLPEIQHIKQIENRTHHDVKAIEYYLREQFQTNSLKDLIPFIHFGLTSEDINNLCYRLMVLNAQNRILIPKLVSVLRDLSAMISLYADLPMLARTHGQPAIPTTLGKELSVFAMRFLSQIKKIIHSPLTGKLNGAVGSYQALFLAYPQVKWHKFSDDFINSLGLQPNRFTTQINPYDDLIDLFHHYHHLNSILNSLCHDIWTYISDDWLVQKGKCRFIGSSTMPQKVNPIEFENAEGNLTLSNGLFEAFSRKLPLSRLQHDLSDSTIRRSFGVAFGHSLIAYHSLERGLKTLRPNRPQISSDLYTNYAILGEALQTILRKQGKADAYEIVASQFKEKKLTQTDWQSLAQELAPALSNLTPDTYLGLSAALAQQAKKEVDLFLTQFSREAS